MDYDIVKCDGYNIHLINTNKSKSIYFNVNMGIKFNKDTYYKYLLMFDLLTETNKNYKTKREMALHLEDIYGASLFSDTYLCGNYYINCINSCCVNPKYLKDYDLLENLIKSLFECIFEPNISDGHFDIDLVEQRKQYFIEKTKRNYEYPGYIVSIKSERLIDEDIPLGYDQCGTAEQIQKIDAYELVDIYNEIMKESNIDIIIGGDLDKVEIIKLIKKYAKFNKRNYDYSNLLLNPKVKEKPTKEKLVLDNNQSTYVEHYNIVDTNDFEKYYVVNIFDAILGNSGLETKLSRKVRKDNSLCYSISSCYSRINGLMRIVVSLDKKNVKKAQKLIKSTLEEMKDNITEEELDNAKKVITNEIIASYDSVVGMLDQVFYQQVTGLASIDERLKRYNEVTIDDVKKIADKLILNTEFLLEGSGSNEED